jgi:ATP-dependent RNA helicase RhlE
VLIFSRTKHGAKKIAASLRAFGHAAAELHSNRSLGQRREALDGFRNGKYRILVATDIAARGIDVKGIELVLNYDLPDNAEDYVHRIGRTARAGASGHAISFATPDQKFDVRDIERLIRGSLPLSKVPELPPARASDIADSRSYSSSRPSFGRRPYSSSPRPYSSRPSFSSHSTRPPMGGASGARRPSHTAPRPMGAPHGTFPRRPSSSRPPRRFPQRGR